MGTIAYQSDDEYSIISDKGDIGFVDFDKYKSACSYNPNEVSDIVVISVPFPLIEEKPKSGFVGETVADSVTIENTTNETLELWSIKIYDSKPEDSFLLSLMKRPTACSDVHYVQQFMESFRIEDRIEDRMLRPGQPLTVWLTYEPKEIGLLTSAVHFNVGDDPIERLVFVLAEDKVPSLWVSNRSFRYRLPSYHIPGDVGGMIEKKQFPDEDMRYYDMESITMKRRGPQFLSLVVPGLAERRPSVVYGDYIFARLATAGASDIITPYQEEVYLKFDQEFHINHVAGNLYNVQFAFNRMGVRRLHQAIEATESLDEEILFPSSMARARNIQAARLAPLSSMLNKDQRSAVEKIHGCKGGAPYVIHGPPYTGKTRTLIEAIIQLHIMRKDVRTIYLRKLVIQQNIVVQDHEILRLNALTRLLDDVNPSYIRFCNCISSLGRRHQWGHFSHIFLDEAGQASKPDTVVPLSHLLRKETVVILAGNPKQLGPIVFSKDAENYGLGNLYGALDENYAIRPVRNYWCHQVILRLSSKMFYGGELIPCKEDKHFHRLGIEPSKVVEIIRDLIENKGLKMEDIGVITPYRQQVLKIRRALESYDWVNIKVGSVEQFKGFVSHLRRFNVAATRARSLLVVIGNPHIICKDPYWNKLLWYYADNGSYKGWFLPEKLEIPQEDSGQANNWYDDRAQEHNWDSKGAQAKGWGYEQAQASDWDQDQGGQVNDWDQDEGGQVNDWDQELEMKKALAIMKRNSLQPSPYVQQGTVHQTGYIPDPFMDVAEWSDGWK
ncbi:unnamed protein product [Withania somnifera]